jgi:PIN domain nuclease of toxin-antitoxin system
VIHLDTHIVIWAYARRRRLSRTAERLLEREDCLVSPAALLEIESLFEIGRIQESSEAVLAGLRRSIDIVITETPFLAIVDAARTFAWTREPFDRLIVANAMADGVRLLTADELILRHFSGAVW